MAVPMFADRVIEALNATPDSPDTAAYTRARVRLGKYIHRLKERERKHDGQAGTGDGQTDSRQQP